MSVATDLIAGSLAGAAQVLVGQPLDTIKTRAQIAPRKFGDYMIQEITLNHFFLSRNVCS